MSHLIREASAAWGTGALLGSVATVAFFVAFVSVLLGTWSRRNDARYAEAARLPLADDDEVWPKPEGRGE